MSLIIRKMQIKTTMRYHFTPFRMTIIKKSTINKLARMQNKEKPGVLLVGMQTDVATVESSMEFPQKIKNGSAL